jgi:hypothetical protein
MSAFTFRDSTIGGGAISDVADARCGATQWSAWEGGTV